MSNMSFECEEIFLVPPFILYQVFVDAKMLTQIALGSPAKVDVVEQGGFFELFNGSISGRFVSLEDSKRIVQDWRFNDWKEGVYSRVELCFDDQLEGTTRSTKLRLRQENIPPEDKFGNPGCIERCRNGWKQNFWDRIEKVLGFPRVKS